MVQRAMAPVFGLVLLPLTIIAGGIGMATTFDDPMWLVAGAVLAIATGFFMRGNSGR
ncbi:MAG: hypothetical protein KDJ37_13350 [Hyphomicrobiaceae bacterium]|nr:hypothetical protein [Hyphomicrobiaceae bacterium]